MISEGCSWISENVGVILLFVFVALLYIAVYFMWSFPGEFDDSQYDDPGNISPANRVRKYQDNSDKDTDKQIK